MTKIEGSYIQNAEGYYNDEVTKIDIDKALNYLPTMYGEHGAFWVGVYRPNGDEFILELHKNLTLFGTFGENHNYRIQLKNIKGSKEFFDLLLNGKIEELIEKTSKLISNLPNKENPLEKRAFEFCIVGNIVDKNYWGEEKFIRRGNKQFRPGAKVYCLPEFGGMAHESMRVLGKPRKQKSLINIVINTRLIKNFRVQKVYNPKIQSVIESNFYYCKNQNSKSDVKYLNEMANFLGTMTEEIE